MSANSKAAGERVTEYVTVMIGGQLFGLPIARVQDVFKPERLTPVPLAPAEVAGLINLRGRVVTAIDMRRRLGMQPQADRHDAMAIGIESRSESFGLLVDAVGEVQKLSNEGRETSPVNLDPRLTRMASGVYRLDDQLLVLLDVDRVLEAENERIAA